MRITRFKNKNFEDQKNGIKDLINKVGEKWGVVKVIINSDKISLTKKLFYSGQKF